MLIGSCFALTAPSSGQETRNVVRVAEDDSYAARVSEIFASTCVTCHGGSEAAAGLSLEAGVFASELVGVASLGDPDYELVVPGIPESSYLIMKITGDERIVGSRMPLAGAPLSEEEISAIEGWIMDLGAKGTRDRERTSDPVSESPPPAFAATRLINLPTTLPIGDHELLFRVSHRFLPPVTSDYDPYWYGLNGPANVFIGLGYGITDKVSVTVGHSNVFHEYEMMVVWMPLPGDGSSDLPVSAGIAVGAGLMSQTQEGEDIFRSENMRFSIQVPVGWQLHDRFSLLAVPGYASNTNHWEEDSDGTFSAGIGFRASVTRSLALTSEWTKVLDGYETGDDSFGVCFEYEIGGHVFQVLATNGTGLTTGQYVPGAVQDFNSGDLRLGFNIFRTFWL
jgi:mono/diheme cytochrome c family protein